MDGFQQTPSGLQAACQCTSAAVELRLPWCPQTEIPDQLWLAAIEKELESTHWLLRQDGSRVLEPEGAQVVVILQG